MNGGIINTVTRLQLVGYFYWVTYGSSPYTGHQFVTWTMLIIVIYPQFLICLLPLQMSGLKQTFCYLEDCSLHFSIGMETVLDHHVLDRSSWKLFIARKAAGGIIDVIFALSQPVSCITLCQGERERERETPVLVRLKLLDGGCRIHKMDNSKLVGHMWRCLGLARASRWRDLELSQWSRVIIGCDFMTLSRELPDVKLWLWSRSYRMWRSDVHSRNQQDLIFFAWQFKLNEAIQN